MKAFIAIWVGIFATVAACAEPNQGTLGWAEWANVQYRHDERTGLCFAQLGYITRQISHVPCTEQVMEMTGTSDSVEISGE